MSVESGDSAISLSFDATRSGINILQNGMMNLLPFLANKAAITFDYIGVVYSDTVTEVYSLNAGGATGAAAATFTVVYSDAAKKGVASIAQT